MTDAYGITLEERSNEMGEGERSQAGQAKPWISQMRRHLIRSHRDPSCSFQSARHRAATSQLPLYRLNCH